MLCDGLERLGWDIDAPKATMFVWARIPEPWRSKMGSIDFAMKLLKEADVAVSPGGGFGPAGEGYLRLAMVENENRLRQAVRQIGRCLGERKGWESAEIGVKGSVGRARAPHKNRALATRLLNANRSVPTARRHRARPLVVCRPAADHAAIDRQILPPAADALIIDVGCGTGGNIAGLADAYPCVGIDTSAEAVALAKRRFPQVQFVCGFAPQDLGPKMQQAKLVLLDGRVGARARRFRRALRAVGGCAARDPLAAHRAGRRCPVGRTRPELRALPPL